LAKLAAHFSEMFPVDFADSVTSLPENEKEFIHNNFFTSKASANTLVKSSKIKDLSSFIKKYFCGEINWQMSY